MRGQVDPQSAMFHYFSAESRVPSDHPLRAIKDLTERALSEISSDLDALYPNNGRPSIAPERLLKGQLLMALYSVRSDRQFCEQLDYNILFRWFLDMNLEAPTLDQSNFSRLRTRLVDTDIARRFFDEVVRLARARHLLSSDHFTVDGTLIDAWASFKSFKRKDSDEPPKSGGDGTGMVDFKGEKRGNATHESSTDPEARLMRKGNGQAARLSYGAHVLMENRSGLCVDVLVTPSTCAEHRAAVAFIPRPWVRTRVTTSKNLSSICERTRSGHTSHESKGAKPLDWMGAPPAPRAIRSASENAKEWKKSSAG